MENNMSFCKVFSTLIVGHCCRYSISQVLIVFMFFYRVIDGYHLAEGHDVAKRIDPDSCLGKLSVPTYTYILYVYIYIYFVYNVCKYTTLKFLLGVQFINKYNNNINNKPTQS